MLDEYAIFVAPHKTILPLFSFFLGIVLPEAHRFLEGERKETHLFPSNVNQK